MRKTLFYAVLFAIPLAAGANAPESDEQDPEIEQGLDTQEQRGQETEPQFEEASEETEQGFEATGEEFEEAAQETEQEFEEAGSEMDQETDAEFEQASGQDMSQQAGGTPELKRAQFTTDVQDKEPVDELENVEASEDPIFFFTEVENAEGQTITHRWKRDGEVMAEVPLEVGSNEWRTWSSKEMMPDWEGEWTVEVVDAQGNTISEESVTVERGQQQNVGYSEDEQQEGEMQEAGQEEQQTESEDWQDVEFQDDAQAEDAEAETEVQEEDWQSVEYEDSAQDPEQSQDPALQEAGEQQDDQATEDEEDWVTRQ